MIQIFSFLILWLNFSTAHALQCGTPGSKTEQRNLRSNNGMVVIEGVPRYGLYTSTGSKIDESCTAKPENLAMFRYSPQTNLVALFHCVAGQVYFREDDNINFTCDR